EPDPARAASSHHVPPGTSCRASAKSLRPKAGEVNAPAAEVLLVTVTPSCSWIALPAPADTRWMSARRYVSTAWTRLLFAGARGQGQLLRDVAHVRLDGGRCNPEPLRDAAVGQALGHQREHFALAAAQGVDRVRASTAFEHLVDQGSIDHE